MTTEQLEELLKAANAGKWVRGFNDYGKLVARLNYGGIYGTAGDGFKEELDLLMLAPSLARRVICAEKLVEAGRAMANDAENGFVTSRSIASWDAAHTEYREASK